VRYFVLEADGAACVGDGRGNGGLDAAPEGEASPPEPAGEQTDERWPKRVESRNGRNLIPNAADDMARCFLRDVCLDDWSRLRLRRWKQVWYAWDGKRWVEVEDEWLRGEVRAYLRACDVRKAKKAKSKKADAEAEDAAGDEAKKAGDFDEDDFEHVRCTGGSRLASDVIDALRGLTLVGGGIAGQVEPFTWINEAGRAVKNPPIAREHCIAFADCLVDAQAWGEGRRDTRRACDPHWWSMSALDFALPKWASPGDDAEAWKHAPLYRRYVEHLFGEDVEDLHDDRVSQIDTWHEWLGYCMAPDTSLQKILAIQGPTGSGKGTAIWLLTELLGGKEQVCSTTLTELGGNFGLEPMVGKLAAVIPDAKTPKIDDALLGTERLLMISGEDDVGVTRKTIKNLGGVSMMARFTLSMNEPVRLPDDAGAFDRRMVWLHTPKMVDEKDTRLRVKLADELPAIAVLALNALGRLRARGQLQQPPGGLTAAYDFRAGSQALRTFIDAACVVDAGGWVATDLLLRQYGEWCKEEGQHELGAADFGRKLRLVVPTVRRARRGSGSERYMVYEGIRLRDVREQALLADLPV
jgi:hypothetical protein